MTTYTQDGTASTPTITGLSSPEGVAVDRAGKIYITDDRTNAVTTYNPDGSASTPTITGLNGPVGVAVDAAGKIYVANSSNNTVTTYNADGSPSIPTLTDGLSHPTGLTVDSAGKSTSRASAPQQPSDQHRDDVQFRWYSEHTDDNRAQNSVRRRRRWRRQDLRYKLRRQQRDDVQAGRLAE